MMMWKKALAVLVTVSMLALPVPAYAHGLAAPAVVVEEFPEYAAREAQAADLESWTGGWHGIVVGVLVLFLVVWLIVELSASAVVVVEPHHHRGHGPPRP